MQIGVKFEGFPMLECEIHSTNLGRAYFNLVKQNYANQSPVYRDRLKFTKDYVQSLAHQANDYFGWQWSLSNLNLSETTIMHKDIEALVGTDFSNVPEHLDNVVHDLHYGLHLLQDNTPLNRLGWMQIEWYNDNGFDADDVPFTLGMEVGDLRLQNPFVGHGPLQIYLENDYSKISQTCKFHNFVRPGINIVTLKYDDFTAQEDLIAKFKQADPMFVEEHGVEKIVSYTGYPVIGKTLNVDVLNDIIEYPNVLEFQSLEFS
jgi:hypothetical protein